MVFMLRLILGLILILSSTSADLEQNLTTITTTEQNEIIQNNGSRKNFNDKDVENIVQPYKFIENGGENQTIIKLKQSEPYDTKKPINSTRVDNGRSIDIDIDKISSDFHNAVYTINDENNSFELTTPKTPFFDKKFRETVESIDGKLDQIDHEKPTFFDKISGYSNNSNNGIFPINENGTSLREHTRKIENIVSYNETKTYSTNELNKDNLKFLTDNEVKKGEKSKEFSLQTSTKNFSVPKPILNLKNDGDIIDNKIINENSTTIKPTNRGSIKFTDYLQTSTEFPRITSENPKISTEPTDEQIVQENQIVPVQVTVKPSPSTTTTSSTSYRTQDEQTQQSTTVFIFVDPDTLTENQNATESTTENVTDTPQTENLKQIENFQSTTEESTTNNEDLLKTTENFLTTTENLFTTDDDFDIFGGTEIIASTPKGFTLQTEKDDFETTTVEIDTTTTTVTENPTTATEKITNATESEYSAIGNLTTTETLQFIHVKSIDKNHTTLLPDILKSKEIYTTPVHEEKFTTSKNSLISSKTTYLPYPVTDSVITEETTRNSELDNVNGTNGAIVAIIIFCVGGICLIVLAGLLIVMRNRQKRFNYGQRCRPVSLDDYSVDNVSVFNSVRRKNALRASKRSYGNPAFEDPVCLSHPLNFPSISKFASNIEDLHAEFHEIPQIIARTSELPDGCEIKNRYANVIPLPESRVFLNQMEGYPNSDYINANYVTGPKNIRKYYIACQAPLSNTVDDFWRMVWEQQSKVILMLTHLFENGIEKCFDYLPPSEVSDCHRLFGDFQVTLKKREVKEKYIISSIQLKNMVSNSWREVTHFWYMGWPEKGVPNEANSIIAFLIEARSYMKTSTLDKKNENGASSSSSSSSDIVNPVIVHCSPGTGRTGVIITCDIAIREFEQTRQVDIPKIVYKIRRDRASAVQTKEQYAFIYKVIDLYATKLTGGNLESI